MKILKCARLLFDCFNSNDVKYCHWKSNERLLDGLNAENKTDLDILVSFKDKKRIEVHFENCKYKKLKSPDNLDNPNMEGWIALDEETGKFVYVHLHYKIIAGHKKMREYDLPWTDLALDTRIHYPNTDIYVMEPNLELVTLYTRIALTFLSRKKNKISKGIVEKDQKEINYLKHYVSWDKVKLILKTYFGSDSQNILELIKKEKLSHKELTQLILIIKKTSVNYRNRGKISIAFFKFFYFTLRIKRVFLNRFLKKFSITKKVLFNKKGLMVAFVGQDGAGKSTITKEISEWLSWKFDAKKIYLGVGDGYFSWQKKKISWIGNKKGIYEIIKKMLFISMFIARSKLSNRILKKSKKFVNNGGIIVFDRFPQMQFEGLYDGPKVKNYSTAYFNKRNINSKLLTALMNFLARREEKFLEKSVKQNPDLVIKLILPPEVSIDRKPYQDFNEIIKKHEITKQLTFENSTVHTIDASKNYEEEMIEIKKILWQNMQS